MDRRGQAALEFLTTYGWALLVILAAIGALAYFGMMEPGKSLPSQCITKTPMTCVTHKASVTDGIQLKIINNAGKDMAAGVTVNFTGCGVVTAPTYTPNNQPITGSLITFNTGACDPAGLLEDDWFSGDFVITYRMSGESTVHTSAGMIRAVVEP